MSDLQQAALELAEQGWYVFPLRRNEKRPLIREWHKRATNDVAQVGQWWQRWPEANIGIACGPSGIVVIDLDVKPDVDGKTTWQALCQKHGLSSNQVETITVATPSGGKHLYFLASRENTLRNTASRLGPGIDTRADGGYVVSPPSRTTQGHYTWTNSDTLLPLPQAILDLLVTPTVQAGGDPGPAESRPVTKTARNLTPYVQTALDAELDRLRNAIEGTRNNTLNQVAYSLGTLTGTNWANLNRDEIEHSLLSIALAIGLKEKESVRTITSGLDAGEKKPRPEPDPPISSPLATKPQGRRSDSVTKPPAVPPVKLREKLPLVGEGVIRTALEEEEYGDAKLLTHLYQNRLVYDHSEKAWYLWNGHAWTLDRTDHIKQLLAGQGGAQYMFHMAELNKRLARERDENEMAKLKKTIDELYKRTKDLHKVRRTKNALEFAQSFVGITGDEWDADPWLLGVENGVIDLKTGELRPGQPHDYIRTVAPTRYEGLDTPSPRWDKFIREILAENKGQPIDDEELVSYAQQLLGYSLTGFSIEAVLPILWGEGRNGKDTLLETLAAVLGPYAKSVSKSVLVAGDSRTGAATPHLMDLQGRRLVWVSETNEGEQLNASQVKLITGGGQVTGRPLYGQMRTFHPTHLLLLITNNRPHAPADDQAIWDRISLIPFEWRFVDHPSEPNERKRKPHLVNELKQEASGILAWLVRGCLEWQKHGLLQPERVKLATESYRDEEDTLGAFFEDRCILADNVQVGAGELYQAYSQWALAMNISKPLAGTTFGKRMKKRFAREHTEAGRIYRGIGLLANF